MTPEDKAAFNNWWQSTGGGRIGEKLQAEHAVKWALNYARQQSTMNQNEQMLREALREMVAYLDELGICLGSVTVDAKRALAAEPAPNQMHELEAKVRAQANLIKAMEQTQSHLSSQKAKWEEATRTLESEREANRILTQELEQFREALLEIVYENNGRYFIGIHGDTDVTDIVANTLSATVKESLTHESAPLVRLTRYDAAALELNCTDRETGLLDTEKFASAIQDAMIAKNGGPK